MTLQDCLNACISGSQVSVSCTNQCYSSSDWSEPLSTLSKILFGIAAAILVILSMLIASMMASTLGLDMGMLQSYLDGTDSSARRQAKKVAGLRSMGSLLLCTLLITSSCVNAALTVILTELFGPLIGFFLSFVLVLMCVEILPPALCSNSGLQVASYTSFLTRLLLVFLFPLSWPLSILLDKLVSRNKDGGTSSCLGTLCFTPGAVSPVIINPYGENTTSSTVSDHQNSESNYSGDLRSSRMISQGAIMQGKERNPPATSASGAGTAGDTPRGGEGVIGVAEAEEKGVSDGGRGRGTSSSSVLPSDWKTNTSSQPTEDIEVIVTENAGRTPMAPFPPLPSKPAPPNLSRGKEVMQEASPSGLVIKEKKIGMGMGRESNKTTSSETSDRPSPLGLVRTAGSAEAYAAGTDYVKYYSPMESEEMYSNPENMPGGGKRELEDFEQTQEPARWEIRKAAFLLGSSPQMDAYPTGSGSYPPTSDLGSGLSGVSSNRVMGTKSSEDSGIHTYSGSGSRLGSRTGMGDWETETSRRTSPSWPMMQGQMAASGSGLETMAAGLGRVGRTQGKDLYDARAAGPPPGSGSGSGGIGRFSTSEGLMTSHPRIPMPKPPASSPSPEGSLPMISSLPVPRDSSYASSALGGKRQLDERSPPVSSRPTPGGSSLASSRGSKRPYISPTHQPFNRGYDNDASRQVDLSPSQMSPSQEPGWGGSRSSLEFTPDRFGIGGSFPRSESFTPVGYSEGSSSESALFNSPVESNSHRPAREVGTSAVGSSGEDFGETSRDVRSRRSSLSPNQS